MYHNSNCINGVISLQGQAHLPCSVCKENTMKAEIERIQQRAELIGLGVAKEIRDDKAFYAVYKDNQILIKLPENHLTILTLNAFLHGWSVVTEQQIPKPEKVETVKPNKIDFPANPIAASLMDLVTAKQLGMIRAISREIGIDADEECNDVLYCKTDELSKKAASAFIQHLQDIQKSI